MNERLEDSRMNEMLRERRRREKQKNMNENKNELIGHVRSEHYH